MWYYKNTQTLHGLDQDHRIAPMPDLHFSKEFHSNLLLSMFERWKNKSYLNMRLNFFYSLSQNFSSFLICFFTLFKKIKRTQFGMTRSLLRRSVFLRNKLRLILCSKVVITSKFWSKRMNKIVYFGTVIWCIHITVLVFC